MRLLVAGLLLAYGQVALAGQHTIPLFVPSSDPDRPPGVLRIINHDSESGSVEIAAIDDAGVRSGPVTLMLDAGTAVELDATDLEMGNPSKGLSAGVGAGAGDWRLEIDSELDIEPLAYVRTADGFVASMHDLVREENMRYSVPVFNSGANLSELSRLRLINPGGGAAAVAITATDDAGAAPSGSGVRLTLPAGGARTLTAGQLEAGGSGLGGRLGTGTGKWRLVVTADRPILVMNLLANSTGRLGNLSTSSLRDNAPGSHAAFGSRFAGKTLAYTVDGETGSLDVLEGGRFTDTLEVGGVSSTDAGDYGYQRTGLNAGRLTLTYDDGDECLDNVYFTSTTAGWFTSSCTDIATVSGSWNAIQSSEALPGFSTATIADQTYTAGTAIGALTLPEASGGDGTLSYSLSPSVPGLAFDAATRRLTGTPTAAGSHAMTYTVTDTDGDTDSLGFTITVEAMDDSEPGFDTATIADQAYTAGTAIGALTLPEASGGDGTLSYSLSPSVPGLAFDAAMRRLTGTPTTAGSHAMTYTVTDSDGDSDTLGFTITVAEMGAETPGDCRVGLLVSPGGSCTYPGTSDAFSVDQDGRARFLVISSALAINVNSATFMGRFYDFRASHQGDGVWRIDRLAGSTTPTTGGGTDTDTSPAFPATGGPGDQTFTLDTAIAALTLPAATGGDGTLSYSLSPSVPGLSFDAATRQLTGTPTAAGTHAMTYTVTDEDGDTDSLGFTITVQDGGVSGSPDLVVQSPSVSDATPEPGASVTFSATLRNQGAGESAATTLRYYRSTDATISTADTEVGTDAVSGLAASGTSDESIDLTTPSAAGTYYFGACVDLVSGESNTGNNCSGALRVTVSDSQSEIESFDLDPRLRSPDGITYADGRFYVVHKFDKKVYAYQMSWQRDPAFDFDLYGADSWATGIAYGNGRFHVVDQGYDKVYAYLPSGQRDSGSDFSLVADNDVANGLAYADDKLYVVGLGNDRKVYAYLTSGQRASTFDFNLKVDRSLLPHPSGVAYANGRFYVLEEHENRVYAYLPSGQRASAHDFDLAAGNNRAGGIAYANGKFHVVDKSRSKVYVYPDPAQEGGDGSETRYGVGAEVTTLPTGAWTPDATSGASFSSSGGSAAIDFGDGGYVEEGGYRYTCASAGGCQVRGREVRAGVIVQTSTAGTPGDTQPSFAGVGGPGDQTYTAGTAIDALRLPEASGGDGALTYSLSPNVPGLAFDAATRRLTGTPTAAGSHAMTYTATDSDGDSDTLGFTITVQDAGGSGGPDLVVEFSVSDASRDTEMGITLEPRVRNQGDGPVSSATTLRYYLSVDATISTADSELLATEIDIPVTTGITYDGYRTYTPSSAGMHYYGACVDTVDGESDATNNCSPGVLVTVTEAVTGFDLDEKNGSPRGIAYANGRFYVGDFYKVYAYEASGRRDPGADFDVEYLSIQGISHGDERFYAVDDTDDKVYVHEASGQRVPDSDFDLDGDNDAPRGIAYANGRLYVVDDDDEKVYAYEASGQRDPDADFNLDRYSDGLGLIAYANGRFHVARDGEKVYAYEVSGQRDPDSDFELDNFHVRGIGYANGNFYTVDGFVTKVFEYPEPDRGGSGTRYGVGDVVATLPTENWFPDLTRGNVSFRISGGSAVIDFGNGGYIEEGSYRFTCASASGCQVRGREVRAGVIVQTSTADTPEDAQPSFGTATIADQAYTADTAIGALTLPDASGGDGALAYSLSPNVPGLTFDAATRQLTGTPTTAGTHAMTYTVTDADGDSDTLSFGITVEESAETDTSPVFPATGGPGDQTYTVDTAIATLTLPAASGGDGELSYSLSPSVPGLTFDAATRQLTGTPTAAGTHAMTYTVTDADGDTDTLSFSITVEGSDGGTPGANEGDCQVGLLVSPGGSCTYPGTADAFTVDQDGRARFLVISSTRAINVNSVTFMGRFYDFRASHQGDGVWRIDRLAGSTTPTAGGGTDGGASPTFPATGGPGDQSYTLDTAIVALTLPAASGGDGDLVYSLSPSVPGLSFDAATRRLTGTPTTAGTHAMTYTVTDPDGDTDSLSFTIRVEGGGVSGGPDLVVQSPSVSDASPEQRASITFSATVRNEGTGPAATSTLRYYRSTDATISTADTEVGRDAVGSLAASAASDESISLTAPSTAGTYYFGACVDLVSGESNAGNNCSSAATVTVAGSDRIAPVDLQAFNSLMIDNRLSAETYFVDFVSNGRFIESGGIPGSYSYAGTGLNTGTLTLTYDRGNYGGACTIQLTFATSRSGAQSVTCQSGLNFQADWRVSAFGELPAPRLAPRSGTDTVLDVTLVDRFEARETRAYDVQFRTKSPRGSWRLGCNTFTNNSSSSVTSRLSSGIGNLQPGTVHQVRYRYRNSSSCSSGSPAAWSDIGEGRTSGEVTLGFSDGESTTRSVPENSPSGINVGIPVAAVSPDAVTYSLGGADAGSFDIVSETGQIRTTEGIIYDFERKSRYTATVGAQGDAGESDTIRVSILLNNLVPSCTLLSNVRINSGNRRLTVRWDSAREPSGQAPLVGYETEIRRGDSGAWNQRRTILGRNIGATIYGDLVNGIGYQVRVRPITMEGDCGWSIPVPDIPTEEYAPKDADDLIDRFDTQPVGSRDRNWRFLTQERCRHSSNGVTLDANCVYQNTGPNTGTISLEFDDPSQGSCEISLAYSSLTAGSFIDECFDAGVNTNVPFDRSFRMPPLGSLPEDEIDVPRAPRTTEEFEVLAWGRDDFIPGLFFGCFSESTQPGCTLGSGYRVERDPVTGVRNYYTGDYTYENTGPSQGVLTFQADEGGSYTFTLDFEPSGSMRVTITDASGSDSEWPGLVGLGTQPILLPIPPSWSAAIAIETDFAPEDWEGLEYDHSMASDDPGPFSGIARALFGGLYRRVFDRDYFQTFDVTFNYEKLGRNRAVVTYSFWDDPEDYDNYDDFGKEVLGSTWVYELRFTSEGTAEYTLTITNDGHLPTVAEGVVDFHGDGINFNEFPDELLLPDDPPQASGEDRSGIEIAAAVSSSRIGPYDLQPFLLNNPGAQPISYSPGDWLEPKDGSNQRMMIVAADPVSAQGSGLFTAAIASFGGRAGRPNQSNANFTITELSVVCMQQLGDIPKRGGRYFSQPKTAQGAIQECQRNCVSDQALSIQGCVWNCERTGDESASTSVATEGLDDLTISQVIGTPKRQESKGEIFSVQANTSRLSKLSESIEIEIGSRSSFFR